VSAAGAEKMVDDVDRIVSDGAGAPADMIVVGADGDVLVAQLRITAANDGHYVARRIFGGKLLEPRGRGYGCANDACFCAIDVCIEQRVGDAPRDVEKRGQLGIAFFPQLLVRLLKELDHLRRHRLEAGNGNPGGIWKPARYVRTVDSTSRVLRHATWADSEHDELPGRGGRIDQRCRIAPGAAEDCLHSVQTPCGRSLVAQRKVGPWTEGRRTDGEIARRVVLAIDDAH